MRKGFFIFLLLTSIWSCKKDANQNNTGPTGATGTTGATGSTGTTGATGTNKAALKILVDSITGQYIASITCNTHNGTDNLLILGNIDDSIIIIRNEQLHFTGNLDLKIYTFSDGNGTSLTIDSTLQFFDYFVNDSNHCDYKGVLNKYALRNIVNNIVGTYSATGICIHYDPPAPNDTTYNNTLVITRNPSDSASFLINGSSYNYYSYSNGYAFLSDNYRSNLTVDTGYHHFDYKIQGIGVIPGYTCDYYWTR